MIRSSERYRKVGFKRIVKAKTKSGKAKQRTKEFYQTMNPWNDKSPEQIIKEELTKAEKWEIETKKEIEEME